MVINPLCNINNPFCSLDKTTSTITETLIHKNSATIVNVDNSAKPLIITRLLDTPLKYKQSVFLFVKDKKEAQSAKLGLSFFNNLCQVNSTSRIVPIIDEDNEKIDAKINLNSILYNIIKNNIGSLILPIEACIQRTPSLASFSKYLMHFEINDLLNINILSQKLSNIGFERQDFASERGVFSIRGDVIDIFPLNYNNPIRIEFFGDKIEAIYTINPKNKNKIQDLKNCEIVPVNIMDKSFGSILDYIEFSQNNNSNQLYIFNEPAELKNSLEFIDPAAWTKLMKLANNFYKIYFEDLPARSDNVINFDFIKSPIYYYNLNKFREEIQNKINDKWQVIFITKNKDSIAAIIKIESPLITYVINNEYSKYLNGFFSNKQKILLITDKDIFGVIISKNIKKDIKFISELKSGDYIVHYDHGIGRFIGMTKRKIDEGMREFFVLEYAMGDKLFLPVEYSEKLTKYIGVAHPKIHRLHEASWSIIKNKIKDKAETIAKELIEIYAQREAKKGYKFSPDNQIMHDLYSLFPYRETKDQTKVWRDVKNDMEKSNHEKPMDRLVCGDVGFGKTEIAIRAAVKAVQDKKQVALLCPTTILSQQHFDTFINRLNKFNLKIDVLSRFKTPGQQKISIEKIKNGETDIIIGTHRLLSQDIKFKDLGLLIIDEEQKFGVKHKERIKSFKANVDVLTLTATPIPRTLNLSLSGLRDISTIETPPEGRQTVKTFIQRYGNDIIQSAIKKELDRSGQVYYLHNKVSTIQAAAKKIRLMFSHAVIDIAHGQLPENKLAEVMHRFDKNQINILVCSSIVENGLDLPNVNTLIVDRSTNFGLSSLYQLRGRIGRSTQKAYAYFLYQDTDLKEQSRKRLRALLEAKELGSGFKLALRDLEIRGVGNILGKEQSGNVAAIGFNLYSRLLNKAAREISAGKIEKEFDVSIDLPLSAFIPDNFINNDKKKIYVYQEIAGLENIKDLESYKIKLADKYNAARLPQELINLFHIIEIKILCRQANIKNLDTKIITKPTGEILKKFIITPVIKTDYNKAKILLNFNPNWEIYENNLKIEIADLGTKWIDNLKLSLKFLA